MGYLEILRNCNRTIATDASKMDLVRIRIIAVHENNTNVITLAVSCPRSSKNGAKTYSLGHIIFSCKTWTALLILFPCASP